LRRRSHWFPQATVAFSHSLRHLRRQLRLDQTNQKMLEKFSGSVLIQAELFYRRHK